MSKGTLILKNGLVRTGKILNRIQKVLLSMLFWAIIVVLIVLFFAGIPPGVPGKAALVLNPNGNVVEQLSDFGDDEEKPQLPFLPEGFQAYIRCTPGTYLHNIGLYNISNLQHGLCVGSSFAP